MHFKNSDRRLLFGSYDLGDRFGFEDFGILGCFEEVFCSFWTCLRVNPVNWATKSVETLESNMFRAI